MSDPARLIDGTGLDARLLASVIDEPPPPDLLARTLTAVGVAAVPAAPGPPAAPAAAKVASARVAGGGLLGPIGLGVLAGLLTVGAADRAMSLHDRPAGERSPAAERFTAGAASGPDVVVPAAPAAVTSSPTPPPPATVDAPASTRAEPGGAWRPVSPPSSSTPAATGPRVTLATEIALLDEARSALAAGEPARARALMDRYAREIPRGQLAREAALLRAQATRAAQAVGPTNP